MEKIFIIFVISSAALTAACTKQTLYLTPEAKGYIYDSVTKKPLNNFSGNMGFNGLTRNESDKIKSSTDGGFIIPAVLESYYLLRPNTMNFERPPELYISADGYKSKVIDYSKIYWEQVPSEKRGYDHYREIDLGIIYLDPENK